VSPSFRLLTERDVRKLIAIPTLVDAMDAALAASTAGRVVAPVRSVFYVGPAQNYVGVMPGFVQDLGALGTKIVTVFEGNRSAGLPTHFATVLLLDPCTGALRAVMDGRYLTEVRPPPMRRRSALLSGTVHP